MKYFEQWSCTLPNGTEIFKGNFKQLLEHFNINVTQLWDFMKNKNFPIGTLSKKNIYYDFDLTSEGLKRGQSNCCMFRDMIATVLRSNNETEHDIKWYMDNFDTNMCENIIKLTCKVKNVRVEVKSYKEKEYGRSIYNNKYCLFVVLPKKYFSFVFRIWNDITETEHNKGYDIYCDVVSKVLQSINYSKINGDFEHAIIKYYNVCANAYDLISHDDLGYRNEIFRNDFEENLGNIYGKNLIIYE